MTKQNPNPKSQTTKYDLAERTARFGEAVIGFAKQLRVDSVSKDLITQLVRAETSVGANYCEADDATTKKDFAYKIGTCRREAKETKYWIRMIVKAFPTLKDAAQPLSTEAHELKLIFSAILNKRSQA